MNENISDFAKVLGANLASWSMTVSTIQLADVGGVVTICAGLGSIAVSIASVWWIRKQADKLGKK